MMLAYKINPLIEELQDAGKQVTHVQNIVNTAGNFSETTRVELDNYLLESIKKIALAVDKLKNIEIVKE